MFIDEKFMQNDSQINELRQTLNLDNEPWIEFRKINLESLLEKYSINSFAKWKSNFFYKIVRRFLIYYGKFKVISNLYKFTPSSKFFYHDELGLTHSHNLKFTNLESNLTYRSDVFRSLIANEFTESNILYTDLDICFLKKFSTYNWSNAFTSAWGISDFANTAILYLPVNIKNSRKLILDEFRLNSSAWPWVLYSKNSCKKFGIEIRNIADFDPPWTPGSPVFGRSELFMLENSDLDELITWLDSNSFVWHWHNQWNLIPHHKSPYSYFHQKFNKSTRNI
jgi:hypothetical protein